MIPRKLNLGSGKDWREDYLNVDINIQWKPDAVVDMSEPYPHVRAYRSERFGPIHLESGYFDEIRAHDVLEHVPNLVQLMTNCLDLLRDGGVMDIVVPYDLSYGAWQDPTHVRAFNERSWLYYTDWSWYLGWKDARFDLTKVAYMLSEFGTQFLDDDASQELLLRTPRAVDSMQVELTKRPTQPEERTQAESYARRT